MNPAQKFADVYRGRGKEIESRAPSLFLAHILLMLGIAMISVLFTLEGRYYRLLTGGALFLSYCISLSLGFRGKYDASANILSYFGFAFMGMMALSNDLTHPYALHMTALYLVAPTMMTTVISRKVINIYIQAFLTVGVVSYVFVTQVIPNNVDLGLSHLIAKYFGFVMILLAFIAHFVMRKHRTSDHLLKDANEAADLVAQRSQKMESLLREIKESFMVTAELTDEIGNIKDLIGSAGENAEHIRSDLGEFLQRHSSSSKNVDTISGQIEVLNNAINTQAGAQEQTSAATNEMLASINNVAEIVQRKSRSAEELTKTTESGGEQLEDTVMRIQDISKNIEDIQQMVGIINDIASQTNLLSMNAAIEAAHAGDSGRGFAVVAEEIRKLAESSAENATQINAVLQNINVSIDAGRSSGKLSREAFQKVVEEVHETADALNEISNSTHELNTGSTEILRAMESLNELSKQVRDGSDNIGQSQEHIHSFLETTSKGFDSMAKDIDLIIESNRSLEAAIGHISEIAHTLNIMNRKIEEQGTTEQK